MERRGDKKEGGSREDEIEKEKVEEKKGRRERR